MLRAGTLNRRIDIERPPEDLSGAGEPAGEWTAVFTNIAASILVQSGSEANRADAEVSVTKASIRIRYRLGIHAGMRVKHMVGGQAEYYEIKTVNPDETRREHVDLVCETGGAHVQAVP